MADMRIKLLWPTATLLLLGLYAGSISVCAQNSHFNSEESGHEEYEAEESKRALSHYRRARKLYQKGKFEGAIEELYSAAGLREDYPEAQMLLAQALVAVERPREAIAALRGLTNGHRGSPQALKLFGQAYCSMNRLNDAEETLLSAINLARRPDAESHYLLGLVRLRRQDYKGAIGEAHRALVLNPRCRQAYRLLSDAYLLNGRPKLAERALRQQLKLVRGFSEIKGVKQRLTLVSDMAKAGEEPSSYVALRIHRVPQPEYTEQARRNRVEGVVRMQVLFGESGSVKQCLVLQGLGFGLDEVSENAARQIEFTPAQLDGRTLSTWGGVVFRYNLTEPSPAPRQKRDSGAKSLIAISDLKSQNLPPRPDRSVILGRSR
jgi:TonB family protein